MQYRSLFLYKKQTNRVFANDEQELYKIINLIFHNRCIESYVYRYCHIGCVKHALFLSISFFLKPGQRADNLTK